MEDAQVQLSIVIPSYNGARHISETLAAIASQLEESVELVVCDDGSRDGTVDLIRQYQKTNSRVKLFQNPTNLGMDGNFEKVVTHAAGEFFWFCGQDDFLVPGAVRRVCSVLESAKVDFVYVNFGQYDDELAHAINERMLSLDDDVTCRDAQEFLALVEQSLPTFLPAFVMRKSLWDRVDKRPYYGTQYIQLGVLFELLPQLKTYLIATPLVKGRVPRGGWQQDDLKSLDNVTGYLEVLTYHHSKRPDVLTAAFYDRAFASCWSMVIGRLASLRAGGRSLNAKVTARFARLFDWRHRVILSAMAATPSGLFRLVRRARRRAR